MRDLVSRLRPVFFYAALFSLAINLLLLAPPVYMLQVFDRVLSSRSEETLVVLTVAAVVALAFMALLDVLRARLLVAAGVILDRQLGPEVLDGLLARSATLGDRAHVNGLRDVNTLRTFLSGAGLLAVLDAPWLPLFVALIFLFHPVLGAVALAGALVMVLIAVVNEKATRIGVEEAQARARGAGRFIDVNLRNAELVAALGMRSAVTERWGRLNDAALEEQARVSGALGGFSGLTKFMRQLIQLAMLAVGAYLVVSHHLTAGLMIAATLILGRALAPVETLVAGWRSLAEARAAWRRLGELLKAGTGTPAHTDLPVPEGRLDVEQVAFRPQGVERPIIRGVSFSLAPGEALGLIGPSASGKSTLVRLALGIWTPSSGTVRLDGADVAAWPRERLGPHIGYLPQDVELFGGTVAENIARLGEPDAAEVIRAAKRAHVHELILRLPQGYDTEIGEGGAALSPGQRQRIALARALYGRPRVVVLDEPNANLDHEGDSALLRTLQTLKEEGVTVIIVAHRPSLLRGVDRLLVLREGSVDMLGPRSEVMARLTRPAQAVPRKAMA